ncbi:MAG: hypothetical protein BGO40_12545 [Chryseobacterium sp. 39-10]|nr:MAG: hypothetical protein BGO40_12545 [Chryseobacterium sp. 39-10]
MGNFKFSSYEFSLAYAKQHLHYILLQTFYPSFKNHDQKIPTLANRDCDIKAPKMMTLMI